MNQGEQTVNNYRDYAMSALKNAAMYERKKNRRFARLYRARAAYWFRRAAWTTMADMT
jgi:hypothetical protein